MLVDPYWFGVFSTISIEALIVIVVAIIYGRRK